MGVYGATATEQATSYLNARGTVTSWLFTTDHKRIAVLYMATVALMFAAGVLAVAIMPIAWSLARGGWLATDSYQRLVSTHGVTMVFGVLVACSLTVLGHYCVPLMIGARRLAFPALSLVSWFLFVFGALILVIASLTGGIGADWLILSPRLSLLDALLHSPITAGAGAVLLSLLMTGINIAVSVHRLRTEGMSWLRLPLFVWAQYSMSIALLCGIPAGAICLWLIADKGAVAPQRLFLFAFYPVVLVSVLPSVGIVNEVVACFSRQPARGYRLQVFLMLAIAVLAFVGWGQYLLPEGTLQMSFSMANIMIASLLGVPVVLWAMTMLTGRLVWRAPMLFALACIWMFTMGSLMMLLFSASWYFRQTLVEVASFHYLLSGTAMFGYLAGMHFWWPKSTGRMYPERWAKAAVWLMFIGFNTVLVPMLIAGVMGIPSRFNWYPDDMRLLYVISAAGAGVFVVGCVIVAVYLLWSLRYGDAAGSNPWGAVGLEWRTTSPPPPHNFDEPPDVTGGPCDDKPGDTEAQE